LKDKVLRKITMRIFKFLAIVPIVALMLSVAQVQAGVIAVDLGTGAPPATLGGYTMTPFGPDARYDGTFATVNDVPSPLGGTVDFSIPLSHRRIGAGWATWSHGYTGDVYFTDGADAVSLDLPALTSAFYLYAEPNAFSTFDITATTDSGASLTAAVAGSAGANGYGFYATGGDTIMSISVSADPAASGFAIGEFGIAEVPEPTSIAIFAAGAAGLALQRRRRKQAQTA